MYKTEEESETRIDLSVGEDLESFIERIKNGEINKDTPGTKIGKDRNLRLELKDRKESFLLCLLDKEERRKLEQKDFDFMKTFHETMFGSRKEADVPEAEWKASESNLKFSYSYCGRYTYFIDAS